MRNRDSRIQNAAPGPCRITLDPPRRQPRRDGVEEEREPIWSVIWKLVQVNMAALGGAMVGLGIVGPVLGILLAWCLPFGEPIEHFLLGLFLGVGGTALAFALLVWFDPS